MSVTEIWALPFLGPVLPGEDFVRQIMNSLEKKLPGFKQRAQEREEDTTHLSHSPAKPFRRTLMNPACAQHWPSLLINSASAGLPGRNRLLSLASSAGFSLLCFPSQPNSSYFQSLEFLTIPDPLMAPFQSFPQLLRVLFFKNTGHEH